MSAPTPAPGDDRPREGYYPDPSIPGYVRYWNGAAWVPGTSRPAPTDGEPLPPPPGAGTAAPVQTPVFPAPAEETGPVFFDEEPAAAAGPAAVPAADDSAQHGARPEPASAWQADAARQSGLGGEAERRISWGAQGQADPRVPNEGTPAGTPVAPGAAEAAKPPEMPKAPEPLAPSDDHSNPGTVAIRAIRPGAPKPPTGEGTVTFRRPTGPVRPASPGTPATPATPAGPSAAKPGGAATPAASGGAEGTMAIRALRPKSGRRDAGTAAAQASVPPQAPAQPAAPQPQPQSQHSVPQQGGAVGAGGVPSPVTAGPGGGSPSWAQQVHQLAGPGGQTPAQGADEQPVVPWKPVASDPFAALAQAQASARPAGLGRRLAARLIDTVVLVAVTGAAALPLGTKAADHVDSKIDAAKMSGEQTTVWLLDGTTAGYLGLILAVLLLFGVVYEALPTAKWGRTLGKKVCGIDVRDIEGHETPSFGAALRRWLVYSVPGVLVIGLVGVLWCLFDKPWKQCWHDKAANTFVAG
ncbi:RDD family protein [Streptomyces sp. NPDC087300]|uniref:RDD family protein n=1 Tax=Streptomyces sp. NPDC087300 TaxID=3365780 RepID=UPI00382FCF58